MQRAGVQVTTSWGRRGVRLAATVAVAACVLAACSASDDASPSSTAPVSESSSSEQVEEPETTSSTSSTTTSSTTTSTTIPLPVVDTIPSSVDSEPQSDTTIAPEPPPVPTNTMFDPTTPEGVVEQATLSNLAAIQTCARELPNCDVEAATQFSALEYKDGNVALLTEFNDARYEVRNAEGYLFQVEGIEFSDDGSEALVFTCIRDGSQLVAPATDTSPEEVIDEGNVSRKDRYLLRRLGDVWFVTARDPIGREAGTEGDFCQ